MIIQVLLTAGFLGIAFYAYLQTRYSRYLGVMVYLIVLAAIYFVWFPGHSTLIAKYLGIGRGADLVLYVWVLLSFLISVYLHVRIRVESHKVTLLAREIALSRPETARADQADVEQP